MPRHHSPVKPFALLAALALLGGCGSTLSRAPVIGAPAETPVATERSSQFPAVGESTVRREGPAMTPEQKAKAEAEMVKRRSDAAAQRRKQIEQASPPQQ